MSSESERERDRERESTTFTEGESKEARKGSQSLHISLLRLVPFVLPLRALFFLAGAKHETLEICVLAYSVQLL